MQTDYKGDFNEESRAVAKAVNHEAAKAYNNLMNCLAVREKFVKNCEFLLSSNTIEGESLLDKATALEKRIGLSPILIERVLLGIGPYIHACIVCEKLNVGLGTMLDKDLANEPFLSRQVLLQTA